MIVSRSTGTTHLSRRVILLATLFISPLLLPATDLSLAHAQAVPSREASHETHPGQPAGGELLTPAGVSPEARQETRDENDAYRHSAMVQKLGSLLGMNAEQAASVFEIINFALLAVGIAFVLLKTLPKTFRDRNTNIQKALVDARTATEEASVRLNSVEERLTKLDEGIAGMRAQAEQDALADEQRIKAAVEEERRKIVAAAEQEISAASEDAQRRLQQYAAELAIEQAARKLVVTAETDRLIVQSFARRLGVEGPKGGEN